MVHLTTPPNTPKFAGEFRHKVEGKGRVTIPAKWRFADEVEMFMVAKKAKRCIAVMTREEVDRKASEIAATYPPHERADLLDIFGRRMRQVTLDKAGRITIPEDFCRDFGLTGEVWLSGAVETFNIWNLEDFEVAKKNEEPQETELMRKLGL